MNLSIDSEMQRFIEEKVAAGEYATPQDVFQAALAALQLQDSFGNFEPGELDALLVDGEESIKKGGTLEAKDVFARVSQRKPRTSGQGT